MWCKRAKISTDHFYYSGVEKFKMIWQGLVSFRVFKKICWSVLLEFGGPQLSLDCGFFFIFKFSGVSFATLLLKTCLCFCPHVTFSKCDPPVSLFELSLWLHWAHLNNQKNLAISKSLTWYSKMIQIPHKAVHPTNCKILRCSIVKDSTCVQ